jgi:pimeloyl-ACP methyl ester carboxylesterase
MLNPRAVKLDQTSLHYAEQPGEGPPLVLLHGITGSYRTYAPLVSELKGHAHVFLLDHRGHGKSGRVGNGYRARDYAHDLLGFIHQVVGSPAVVAGHSLGALVAACAASQDSSAFRGLFLEDPPMYFPLRPEFKESGFHSFFSMLRPLLEEHAASGGTVVDLQARLGSLSADDEQTMLERHGVEMVRPWAEDLHALDPQTLDAAIDNSLFDGFDPDRALPHITCPTHLLVGDFALGGAMTDDDTKRMASLIPHCTVRVFSDAGHEIHEEKPQEYVQELLQFIRGV